MRATVTDKLGEMPRLHPFTAVEEIIVIRNRLRLTTDEFGKRYGINGGTLRAYESGNRQPSENAKKKLLEIVAAYERDEVPTGKKSKKK